MSTQTLTKPAPANRILPSEQREMDDLIRFAEQRLAAVRMVVGLAGEAESFETWASLMQTARLLLR